MKNAKALKPDIYKKIHIINSIPLGMLFKTTPLLLFFLALITGLHIHDYFLERYF